MSLILADSGLPGLGHVPKWFNDPSNYWGPNGLLVHLREHVVYSAIIVVIAALIALPLGLLIGHTGRGVVLVVGAANGLRAVPALGLLLLLVNLLSSRIHSTSALSGVWERGALPYFIPFVITLVVLAIPPILTNTYAGVQAVDPSARDAARGMGMTGGQIVRKVEFPCALPLIMSGLRSATLQVIATVAVAGYVTFLGGLGRIIADGVSQLTDTQAGYPAMVSAGIVVALLAVVVDLLLNLVQRLVVSPGLTGRGTRHDRHESVRSQADETAATTLGVQGGTPIKST